MAAPRRQLAAAIATGIAASTAAAAAAAALPAAIPGWPGVPPSLQPCAFAAFHGFFGTWPFLWQQAFAAQPPPYFWVGFAPSFWPASVFAHSFLRFGCCLVLLLFLAASYFFPGAGCAETMHAGACLPRTSLSSHQTTHPSVATGIFFSLPLLFPPLLLPALALPAFPSPFFLGIFAIFWWRFCLPPCGFWLVAATSTSFRWGWPIPVWGR